MSIEDDLALLDSLLAPRRLTEAQEIVFRGCWQGLSYQTIADLSGYDADYIRVIGSRLWKLLSEILGEKITKNNFRAALRQRSQLPERGQPSGSRSPMVLPGSPLPLGSTFYLERPPVEQQLYEEIVKPGALIRIRAPQKWGKTSLLNHLLAYTERQGYRNVRLNLQQADSDTLVDLNRFLRWMCANAATQLNLEPRLDEYWDPEIGSKVSCALFIQSRLLSQALSPIVIAFDEVQRLFEYPAIAQDFLPLLRVWHEEARNSERWANLRLVVLYDTEAYVPFNLNQSPFNVGFSLRLPSFTLPQAQEFAMRYGLQAEIDEVEPSALHKLWRLVNGHPYLLHLALHQLSTITAEPESWFDLATTTGGIYGEHLRGYLSTLQRYPILGESFKRVLLAEQPIQLSDLLTYQLESMGLVKLVGNHVECSCELYMMYFRERLDQF